jgi:hypothetical protein
MNARIVFFSLIALCVMLLVTISMEVRMLNSEASNRFFTSTSNDPSVHQDDVIEYTDSAAYSSMITGWVLTILSRPVFTPSRRPGQLPAETPVQLPGTESHHDIPRLAGILISAESKRAIFQPTDSNAKALVGSEGDEVEGWKIKEITAKHVTLSGVGETQIVEPKASLSSGPPPFATDIRQPQKFIGRGP